MVDDCDYYCVALGGWFLCFARRRLTNTYTACHCRDLSGCLVVDWQKTVEITYTLFFFSLWSKFENIRLVEQIDIWEV